jgi:hypothetical protein
MGVDLHLHSTASDGTIDPERIPPIARKNGLHTIALTDHDTVSGVVAAQESGRHCGVTVIAGCEFSVHVWWGELHLLGYFLPTGDRELNDLLQRQRAERVERAGEILVRLTELGVVLGMDAVLAVAGTSSIGRPHIARALVDQGAVPSITEAFDRFLADGKPAFVERKLPELDVVTSLVRRLGGVTSAAHLKQRGDRATLVALRDLGVDAIEVAHPAHDSRTTRLLNLEADQLGLLKTGGSDWHGPRDHRHERLGGIDVPDAWLTRLEALHHQRTVAHGNTSR